MPSLKASFAHMLFWEWALLNVTFNKGQDYSMIEYPNG